MLYLNNSLHVGPGVCESPDFTTPWSWPFHSFLQMPPKLQELNHTTWMRLYITRLISCNTTWITERAKVTNWAVFQDNVSEVINTPSWAMRFILLQVPKNQHNQRIPTSSEQYNCEPQLKLSTLDYLQSPHRQSQLIGQRRNVKSEFPLLIKSNKKNLSQIGYLQTSHNS